jgi:hypothetical protein
MTIKELKEKINDYPDNMQVFVPSSKGDYEFGKVYSVHELEITMQNDEVIDAVVIDEV